MPRAPFAGLLVFFTLALAGCRAPSLAAADDRAPLPHWSGAHSGVTAPATRVVRGAEAWAALWRELDRELPRPLAEHEMAIAVFAGERPTAGHRLEVVSAAEAGKEFVVTYREHTPAPDRMVAQVLTSPWAVVIVPATDLPVRARPVAEAGRASTAGRR